MATIIGLPKLSPTMEEGVLAKWNKKEGDKVSPGDVIAEVETDKANMDFALEDEGTLLKLLVKEGDTVKLGAPVLILGQPGEDTAALEKEARAGAAAPAPSATPAPPVPAAPAAAPKAAPAAAPQENRQQATGNGQQATGRIVASPLAKTLAAEHGIDLRGVKGSGPGGRIVEKDVRGLMGGAAPAVSEAPTAPVARAPVARAPVTPPPFVPAVTAEDVDRPLSLMRKTIAKRLVEAKTQVPHFYLTTDCDAEPLLAFRAGLNELVGEEGKISVNDVVVKAMALALRRMPAVNSAWAGDKIRQHGRVDVGVAVSVEDGLITPIVRAADQKGLARISAEVKDLAARARARKVTPEEMTGATATVSNLGMYGIDHFEAIINPPEAVILAVGAVKKVPVVKGDALAVGQRMGLTLSCDHRVVDGALGARFLAELVKILEHPQVLAL